MYNFSNASPIHAVIVLISLRAYGSDAMSLKYDFKEFHYCDIDIKPNWVICVFNLFLFSTGKCCIFLHDTQLARFGLY